MLITKPTHHKYVFNYLNNSQYNQYAKGYSSAKRNGSRGIYLWATGMGVWGVVKEATKGELKRYGKKKLATACLSAGFWAFGPVVTLITNSSKIIGAATRIHSLVSFGAECIEDGGNLLFLPLDVALFGQPIPVGDPDRFNIMTNFTDFLSE
jgi:hypothetical protein